MDTLTVDRGRASGAAFQYKVLQSVIDLIQLGGIAYAPIEWQDSEITSFFGIEPSTRNTPSIEIFITTSSFQR